MFTVIVVADPRWQPASSTSATQTTKKLARKRDLVMSLRERFVLSPLAVELLFLRAYVFAIAMAPFDFFSDSPQPGEGVRESNAHAAN
jgi:hypothetical protein